MAGGTTAPGLLTQLLAEVIEEAVADSCSAPGCSTPQAPGVMTQLLSELVEEKAGGGGAGVLELTEQLGGLGLSLPGVTACTAQHDSAVGLIYDPVMEHHVADEDRLECPARTVALMAKLEELGLAQRCIRLKPRWATDEELQRTHTKDHIAEVDGIYNEGGTEDVMGDMFASPGTSAAARTAAGCVVEAVQQVLGGSVQSAMAVVRPPGHHAECSRAMGFCFFNNVAVAAQAALQQPGAREASDLQLLRGGSGPQHAHGVDRVCILDWDVHHGNGIQHILEENPSIMYISLHRGNGFFPGTGEANETGTGAGQGYTLNLPWPQAGFGDLDYLAAFELIIEPVLESFSPDLVIVAAGYDAVEGDPLGRMRLTAEGYGQMTHRLMRFAGGRLVAALEGGYNIRATAECAAETVRVLLEGLPRDVPVGPRGRLKYETKDVLKQVAKCHEAYWWGSLPSMFARYFADLFEHTHLGFVAHLNGGDVLAGESFRQRHKAFFDRASKPAGKFSKASNGVEIFV